jgi:multidrug resistance protein, MATE family
VTIACGFALAVFVLRPLIIGGYTPDPAVMKTAMPLVAIVALYHIFDALQVTTAFALRAYKVAVVPTVIYAFALWGVGLGGGYALGFDVTGTLPAWATGARGFWLANMASLAIAGAGLTVYLSRVSTRYLREPV